MGDRDKDAEILALRHELSVLERQLGRKKAWFSPSGRVFLAALLYTGIRRSRYRGQAKTGLAHVFSATAINLHRMDAHWRGRPSARPGTPTWPTSTSNLPLPKTHPRWWKPVCTVQGMSTAVA
ncbi:hypothetical protein [Streptomyces sp. SYSU K217416]